MAILSLFAKAVGKVFPHGVCMTWILTGILNKLKFEVKNKKKKRLLCGLIRKKFLKSYESVSDDS